MYSICLTWSFLLVLFQLGRPMRGLLDASSNKSHATQSVSRQAAREILLPSSEDLQPDDELLGLTKVIKQNALWCYCEESCYHYITYCKTNLVRLIKRIDCKLSTKECLCLKASVGLCAAEIHIY